MPTQNVNLTEQQARFISHNVREGRYRSASEVVRAGLRLLEQQAEEDRLKLKALQRLAKDAFASIDRGEHVVVEANELDDFMDQFVAKSRGRRSK